MIEKDYGFDEVFDIFCETDINCHEHNECNPRNVNKIDKKMKCYII